MYPYPYPGPAGGSAGLLATEGTRPRVEGDREQEIFDATL